MEGEWQPGILIDCPPEHRHTHVPDYHFPQTAGARVLVREAPPPPSNEELRASCYIELHPDSAKVLGFDGSMPIGVCRHCVLTD